ncbi:MAG: hypothetical protein ACTS2F_18820 [Thainema sp.]
MLYNWLLMLMLMTNTNPNKETLIQYLDRLLTFYIRLTDRLERALTGLNKLAGGLDDLKQAVIDKPLRVDAASVTESVTVLAIDDIRFTLGRLVF